MFGKYFRRMAVLAMLCSASGLHAQVVISQVYGGGGNTSAPYSNDFIELFNAGTVPQSLAGYSVQYASATGTSWQVTALGNTTLQPGEYYLVQESAGATPSNPLPTPDATGTLTISSTTGKIALASVSTALTGSPCPTANVLDLVAFGPTATCSEGGTPAPVISNTTSATRKTAGCTSTNNNGADFAAVAPAPRNSSTIAPCSGGGGPTSPTATGAASPASVQTGNSVLFTVAVTPGGTPTSTGLQVSVDMSTIGGSATQAFYDDASNGDVTANDNTFSFATTVSTTGGAKTLPVTITDGQGRTASSSIKFVVTTPPITIMAIQGHGATSPLAGTNVTTTGNTITGIASTGFFMQDPSAVTDVTTSHGIYVYTGTPVPPVVVGNQVTVTANVSDYYSATELDAPIVTVTGSGTMPTPFVLDTTPPSSDPTTGICANAAILPSDGPQANNFSCLDGMLVTINDGVVTGPTFGSGSDGVHQGTPSGFYATVAGTPRPFRSVGAAYPGLGGAIPVWSGDPEIVEIYYSKLGFSGTNYVYETGTHFSITGVIQSYQGAYEIYPISMTTNTAITPPDYVQPVADSADGTLTIGTQNMLHFFNASQDGQDTSTYADLCLAPSGTKGALASGASDTCPSPEEYSARLQKMSRQIRDQLKAPIALGVEEVENYSTLKDLRDQIYKDSGMTLSYQPYTIPGNDPGGINIGLLVRSDVVVTSVTQIYKGTMTTSCNPSPTSPNPCLLNDRPPVLLDATFNGYHFHLLVIYDRSLINLGTAGNNYVGTKRVEEAVQVASIVQALQSSTPLVGAGNAQQDNTGLVTTSSFDIGGDPTIPLIVVGDFNAYEFTDGYVDVTGMITGNAVQNQNFYWDVSGTYSAPSPTLVDSGVAALPGQRYSYNFSGYTQEIDHVLLSRRGWKDFVSVSNAHGNSDVSEVGMSLDTTQPTPVLVPTVLNPSTPAHSSDHDGQVITIAIDRIFADGVDPQP